MKKTHNILGSLLCTVLSVSSICMHFFRPLSDRGVFVIRSNSFQISAAKNFLKDYLKDQLKNHLKNYLNEVRKSDYWVSFLSSTIFLTCSPCSAEAYRWHRGCWLRHRSTTMWAAGAVGTSALCCSRCHCCCCRGPGSGVASRRHPVTRTPGCSGIAGVSDSPRRKSCSGSGNPRRCRRRPRPDQRPRPRRFRPSSPRRRDDSKGSDRSTKMAAAERDPSRP